MEIVCLSCGKILEGKDSISCGEKECQYILEQKVTDNRVTKYCREDEETVYMHFSLSLQAMQSSNDKVYLPKPPIKDLSVVKNNSPQQIITKILSQKTDSDVYDVYGADFYTWCKFTLNSEYSDLIKKELFFDTNKVIYFENKVSRNSKIKNPIVTFHGSDSQRWYSILRNGLKNMSGTSLMIHGQAHGSGIYTSSSINIALEYGKCIAICWVDPNKTSYNSNNIIVSSEVEIKAVVFENIPRNYDWKKMYEPLSENTLTRMNPKKNKKINKEYLMILKEPTIKLEVNDDIFYSRWVLTITDEENLSQIGNSITIEYNFNADYPFHPPFVRMIKPRLKRFTGHITSGGAFCLEELTPQKWSPTNSVYTVIQTIKELIKIGGGELDVNQSLYTHEEAKISFGKIMKEHGWN